MKLKTLANGEMGSERVSNLYKITQLGTRKTGLVLMGSVSKIQLLLI